MELLELSIIVIVGAIFVEGTTELLCKSKFFSWFREWLKLNSSFLGELISCGYCTSVWVANLPAFLVAGLFPLSWFHTPVIFLISLVFFHRIANYLHNFNDKFLDKYYDPRFNDKE